MCWTNCSHRRFHAVSGATLKFIWWDQIVSGLRENDVSYVQQHEWQGRGFIFLSTALNTRLEAKMENNYCGGKIWVIMGLHLTRVANNESGPTMKYLFFLLNRWDVYFVVQWHVVVDLSSINVNIPIKPLCLGFYLIKAPFQLLRWHNFIIIIIMVNIGHFTLMSTWPEWVVFLFCTAQWNVQYTGSAAQYLSRLISHMWAEKAAYSTMQRGRSCLCCRNDHILHINHKS